MKILLTNDDGVLAPGLEALCRVAEGLGQCVVFAPSEAVSGCSHSTTTDRPFGVEQLGGGRYAVSGTPADCVRVAIHRLNPHLDWVLSGINNGGNLGVDVYHSGTVAAVREAAIHGVPGIAVSQFHDRPLLAGDWERAVEWSRPLVAGILRREPRPGTFWNINLPCHEPGAPRPEVVYCPLDPSPLPLSFIGEGGSVRYNGRYRERPRRAGCDVEVCFGGRIAVTEISVMEASRGRRRKRSATWNGCGYGVIGDTELPPMSGG
jgi:5'-nucleotidase